MEQKKIKKLHLIYGCVLSALLILVAIVLIVSCLYIYNSGDHPYSPVSISTQFQKISLLVYVALAAIIGGIAINLIFPIERDRPKAIKDELALLRRQQERAGILTGTYSQQAEQKQTGRHRLKLMCCIIFVAIMILPALYFLDVENFTVAQLNQDIIKALLYCLIPAVVGLTLCYCCKLYCDRSIRRESDIWKAAIKANATSPSQTKQGPDAKDHVLHLRAVIGIIALAFILIGIFNGGAADVLLKAIAICTECIGLG